MKGGRWGFWDEVGCCVEQWLRPGLRWLLAFPRRLLFALSLLALLVVMSFSCCRRASYPRFYPKSGPENGNGLVLVTGYCNCGKCCGWERSWLGLGQPVYSYGPQKGSPKRVGVTARGTAARPGVVAADTKVFPFGTRLRIPGIGFDCVVEDVGGKIKGKHVDVWFPSHAEARRWGARWLKVEVLR